MSGFELVTSVIGVSCSTYVTGAQGATHTGACAAHIWRFRVELSHGSFARESKMVPEAAQVFVVLMKVWHNPILAEISKHATLLFLFFFADSRTCSTYH